MVESAKFFALEELGSLYRSTERESGNMGGAQVDAGPHSVSDHQPMWAYEHFDTQRPYSGSDDTLYEFLPKPCSTAEAIGYTRLHVVLGAADSPQLRLLLSSPNTVVLVFDPSESALATALENFSMKELTREGVFFFSGELFDFVPALQDILPISLFQSGFPVFHVTSRVQDNYSRWAFEMREYLEFLYYRHVIYEVVSQSLLKSKPIREIMRGVMYDQQLHAYENVAEYLTCPDIGALRGAFLGETAILVAAGPELAGKLDYIRENCDRAVIICVNNAVKPLLEAGIHPHFVIINDTSIISGNVFDNIPQSPQTILVGQCLSDLGGDKFKKKFLFGNFMTDIFPRRPGLRLHGSVISTAFSLARLLACQRAVFIGAQLCSRDPWKLKYAKGTINHKGEVDGQQKPLIHAYPQLYPVELKDGRTVFTTLNFRDAALWLSEEIRLSGIDCINTSEDSLLFGKGIRYDPAPHLDKKNVSGRFSKLFSIDGPRVRIAYVLGFLRREMGFWKHLESACDLLLEDNSEQFLQKAFSVLEKLDGLNVSNLLERFEDFHQHEFHSMVFETDDVASQAEGLRYLPWLRCAHGQAICISA